MRRNNMLASLVVVFTAVGANGQDCGSLPAGSLVSANGGSFGQSIAVSGSRAVIGSPTDSTLGSWFGAAYIFEFDGEGWVQEAKLVPSEGGSQYQFGSEVAIDGDIAVIGVPDDGTDGLRAGAVFVFRFNGVSWIEEAKLLAPVPDDENRFGASVAIENNTLIIGSTGIGGGLGAVYVFEFDGSQWIQEATLLGPDEPSGFGRSLAFENGLLAIGAVFGGGQDSGVVFLYEEELGVWQEQAGLTASDASVGDAFGESIQISGEMLVVGATGNSDIGIGAGACYVFHNDGSNWIEEQILFPTDGTPAFAGAFGQSVSVSNEKIVVGDPGNSAGVFGGFFVGAVYVYTHNGVQWVEEVKLTSFAPESFDFLGNAVAMGNGSILAGSPLSNSAASGSGVVREYQISTLGVLSCPGDFTGDCMLNFYDISAFIAAFSADNPAADLNSDGVFDFFDVSDFLAAFAAGCP